MKRESRISPVFLAEDYRFEHAHPHQRTAISGLQLSRERITL